MYNKKKKIGGKTTFVVHLTRASASRLLNENYHVNKIGVGCFTTITHISYYGTSTDYSRH